MCVLVINKYYSLMIILVIISLNIEKFKCHCIYRLKEITCQGINILRIYLCISNAQTIYL